MISKLIIQNIVAWAFVVCFQLMVLPIDANSDSFVITICMKLIHIMTLCKGFVCTLCVFIAVKGSDIKPDPLANKNEQRRSFCAKYDGYGDFCDGKWLCQNH